MIIVVGKQLDHVSEFVFGESGVSGAECCMKLTSKRKFAGGFEFLGMLRAWNL